MNNRHAPHRCEVGHNLWADYVILPLGKKRDDAKDLYKNHLKTCRQCQAWKAEQYATSYARADVSRYSDE